MDVHLPCSNAIAKLDRFNKPVGAMEDEALFVESLFESVMELGVAHGVASCEIRYRSIAA
jgi:hypothetical protein